ncbi:unnamed protein product [Ranitomeya imitator]|uniref:USP domain-containing protein n=1 Tax=Ranitomeya imitator TaxID=111125 RepID=A0ABN9LHV4_9NEOB|nr:unnamed protein product [Ranitomeya imitator]
MTGDNGAAERQPGEEAAEKRDSAPDSCTAKVDITAQVDDECAGIGCCDCASQDRDMLASNDDVIEAVSILTDACESDPKVLVTKPSNPEECDTVVQDADSTIDSSCETDYLQKAIALSLQDVKKSAEGDKRFQQVHLSGGLQCIVILFFLFFPFLVNLIHFRSNDLYNLDNKSRSKRKRCEVWGDVPNPNELRRSGDWPVGLKNIGNTCWFNVVMQSLFHLPEFRRLVHGYRISPNIVDRCRTRNIESNLRQEPTSPSCLKDDFLPEAHPIKPNSVLRIRFFFVYRQSGVLLEQVAVSHKLATLVYAPVWWHPNATFSGLENRNIAFMHELQYLFALMVGSNKKYVDPTADLDLLKDERFLSEEAQQVRNRLRGGNLVFGQENLH